MLSEATQTEIRIQRKLEAAGGNVSYAGRCILDLAAALEAKQREEADKETLAEAIRAREEQRRIGVRALQMANDSENKNNLLRAERDAALAELAQVKEQLTEATRVLCAIQDKAVCDWDDPTVGETRRAIENVPQTYRDAYIALARGAIDAHKRAERAEAALRVCRAALRGCYDVCDWPADGQTVQDDAIAVADAALAAASAQEGSEHAPLQPSACAGRAEDARP